jgi:hypothetical protein
MLSIVNTYNTVVAFGICTGTASNCANMHLTVDLKHTHLCGQSLFCKFTLKIQVKKTITLEKHVDIVYTIGCIYFPVCIP